MKRASYRHAVAWIADNDNPAGSDDVEALASYISVLLVADIFGVEPSKVAEDVVNYRGKNEYTPCTDSNDGKHNFTIDWEYDATGQTVNCEHCGQTKQQAKK